MTDTLAASAKPVSRAGIPRMGDRAGDRAGDRLQRPSRAALTEDSRFSIDTNLVPAGYVLQWKRHTLFGQNDRRNQVVAVQNHWQPVTHSMQPHFYGHTCKNPDEHVIIDGLGLYMRPEYLNRDAEAEQREETDYVLRNQLDALRLTSREQVGDKNTRIKRQVVAAPQDVE